MEGNEVFETEPEVEMLSRMSSRQRPSSEDADAVASAHHTPHTASHSPTETDPLLGKKKTRIYDAAQAAQEHENGQDDAPEWPGQRDFDGLPWWRAPSVRFQGPSS